jgi:predicted phage-related endonuclease
MTNFTDSVEGRAKTGPTSTVSRERRHVIGGSDARVIMGNDETTLVRLWREKRGEVDPEDLSDNLIVQLGTVTEDLNRQWYERNTGLAVRSIQKRIQHPIIKWMAATLDGLVDPGGAVFEAKFMLPWTFSARGDRPCTGPVKPSAPSPQRSQRRKENSPTRRNP